MACAARGVWRTQCAGCGAFTGVGSGSTGAREQDGAPGCAQQALPPPPTLHLPDTPARPPPPCTPHIAPARTPTPRGATTPCLRCAPRTPPPRHPPRLRRRQAGRAAAQRRQRVAGSAQRIHRRVAPQVPAATARKRPRARREPAATAARGIQPGLSSHPSHAFTCWLTRSAHPPAPTP